MRTIPCFIALAATVAAHAQEASFTPAATMPSPGALVAHTMLMGGTYSSTGPDGVSGYLMEVDTMAMLGVAPGVAVEAMVPAFNGTMGSNDPGKRIQGTGLGNMEVDVKLRLLKIDFNAIDTLRVSASAGTQIPTGTGVFGANSVDPFVASALTYINGRHGLGVSARWMFNTGSTFDPAFATQTTADICRTGLSYLYRIEPAEYGHEHREAWYMQVETLGTYETDGSAEWTMGPGILMEGTHFAFEVAVQLPLWMDAAPNRSNSNFTAMFGLRFLF